MEDVRDIESSAGVLEIAVASTATIYTKAISLTLGEYFALTYKATSDGAVKLQIQIEQSPVLPTTEGASDANFVIPEGFSDVESALATETQHIKKIEPICMKYMRLKITGLGAPLANAASTTLRLRLGKRDLGN